ncbi:hypothetical protein F7734_31470 [Scytonema sp. UIC 10036]|uniref:hypothetical protein n=1 Tax=Scytonema sp. UIC 10036 TaxID=2304196 RepID=UPI0012DA2470|nr:hypothetical protein [Scytonema sp. UIC 10036]MUG96614.1 hypothetical protein [Scytonema sp. UIC 10036]
MVRNPGFGGYRHHSGTDGFWLLKFNGKKYPEAPEGGVHLPSNATIAGKNYFLKIMLELSCNFSAILGNLQKFLIFLNSITLYSISKST